MLETYTISKDKHEQLYISVRKAHLDWLVNNSRQQYITLKLYTLYKHV